MKKVCKKCLKEKQDTAFPIYITPILKNRKWIYSKCFDCSQKRIIKRMDKYFNKILNA